MVTCSASSIHLSDESNKKHGSEVLLVDLKNLTVTANVKIKNSASGKCLLLLSA